MGTRSMIGMVEADGSVRAIYCHWDGYVAHVGRVLDAHYDTPEKVAELIGMGNLSSLDVSIGEKHSFGYGVEGQCTFYGRDREEDGQEAKLYSSIAEYRESLGSNGDEYRYLFDGFAWFHISEDQPAWDDVREALKDAA